MALELVLGPRSSSATGSESFVEQTVDIVERLVEEHAGHYVKKKSKRGFGASGLSESSAFKLVLTWKGYESLTGLKYAETQWMRKFLEPLAVAWTS